MKGRVIIQKKRGDIEMTDKEMIACIRSNPSDGIKSAMDAYAGAVYKICSSILSGYSSEDIEETVSDSFFNLWKAVSDERYNGQAELKYYLYGIARKVALNRKRRIASDVSADDISDIDIAGEDNIESQVIDRSQCEIIRSMILSLKSPDKEIFIGKYFEELSVKEIAQRLGISTKKVENVLFRGKEKLKKQLIVLGF